MGITKENKGKEVLSFKESLLIGGATGATEVCINLPLWAIKMRAQCDLPFTMDPKILYRGFSIAFLSMTTTTALQLMSSSSLENYTLGNGKIVTYEQRVLSAFAGGAVAALVFGPINLIGTQQHKHNYKSFYYSALVTRNKLHFKGLFVGTPGTALSDGIFTCAFFGIYPWMKVKTQNSNNNEYLTKYSAGAATGFSAAIISHPIDTIKTYQQRMADNKSMKMLEACQKIYKEKGFYGFFKAFPQRSIWLSSAVTVAGVAADNYETIFKMN